MGAGSDDSDVDDEDKIAEQEEAGESQGHADRLVIRYIGNIRHFWHCIGLHAWCQCLT